ncbi:hypothetical protein ANTPLA_LOCUS65 [Anthophora plagiata]
MEMLPRENTMRRNFKQSNNKRLKKTLKEHRDSHVSPEISPHEFLRILLVLSDHGTYRSDRKDFAGTPARTGVPRISGQREPIKKPSASQPSDKRVYLPRTYHLRGASLLSFPIAIPPDDMYRKIRLGFLAIILLLCLSLEAVAQLNFSTGWGKRSQRVGVPEWAARADCASQAKPSLEQLLTVYNFIQAEVQKMLACRRPNE